MPQRSDADRADVGNLVTLWRYQQAGGREAKGGLLMSVTVPIVALSVLIVLSLIAKQLAYLMTSTSLQFMTAALAVWFLASFWFVG
jgi:hypothetical protein